MQLLFYTHGCSSNDAMDCRQPIKLLCLHTCFRHESHWLRSPYHQFKMQCWVPLQKGTQVCAFLCCCWKIEDYKTCLVPVFSCWPAPLHTWHRKDSWKMWHDFKNAIYLRTSCTGCTRLLSLHLPKRHVKPLRVKAVISQEHLVIFIGQKLKSPIELEYSAIGKEGLAINWVILELYCIWPQFILDIHFCFQWYGK